MFRPSSFSIENYKKILRKSFKIILTYSHLCDNICMKCYFVSHLFPLCEVISVCPWDVAIQCCNVTVFFICRKETINVSNLFLWSVLKYEKHEKEEQQRIF